MAIRSVSRQEIDHTILVLKIMGCPVNFYPDFGIEESLLLDKMSNFKSVEFVFHLHYSYEKDRVDNSMVFMQAIKNSMTIIRVMLALALWVQRELDNRTSITWWNFSKISHFIVISLSA